MIDKIKKINQCGIEYLKSCKENQFDYAIIDPPTGRTANNPKTGYLSANNNIKGQDLLDWDKHTPPVEMWALLFYVSKHQFIFNINVFIKDILEVYQDLGIGRAVWDKMNGDNNYGDGELCYVSWINSLRFFRFQNCGVFKERSSKELRLNEKTGKYVKRLTAKEMMCQKPVDFYRWIYSRLLNDKKNKGKFLDIYGGSSSHLKAAFDYGINLTWIEREKTYFDSSVASYNKYVEMSTNNVFDVDFDSSLDDVEDNMSSIEKEILKQSRTTILLNRCMNKLDITIEGQPDQKDLF